MADLYVGGFVDPASHDRTEDTRLATDSLTPYGVIVGMTARKRLASVSTSSRRHCWRACRRCSSTRRGT